MSLYRTDQRINNFGGLDDFKGQIVSFSDPDILGQLQKI